ncbi:MAG: polysaccharide pyruvyl transferase family protein [Deltaproteobacteria bacterium]|nr:polysaccharide pyruvyl transferase family protein [Deltaproteobacteria bacterium]
MFNVCIMGASLTTGNMGVSALAASLIKLILTIHPDASITFFIPERSSKPQEIEISGRKISIKIANTRLSPTASWGEHIFVILFLSLLYKIMPFRRYRKAIIKYNERLRAIVNADFIGDVRGGDSFSDIYGVKGFLLGSIPSIITLLMGKKLVLFPQTYGPYTSRISRIVARYILSHAHIILSRDRESMEFVQDLLGKNKKDKTIMFCPDVAFSLDSIAPQNGDIPPFVNTGKDSPVIGLNINGLLYNGGYTRNNMFNLRMDYKLFVHKLSEAILKKTNANLLLIPHTFAPHGHVESDPDACQEILTDFEPAYKGRVQMISGEYDQHAIKGIIGRCDFFIGSRMHACIAALSQKIPTAAVAYSKKFKGVFNSIDVGGFVIDAREEQNQVAIGKIMTWIEDRAQIKNILQVKIDSVQNQQIKIFSEITHAAANRN